MLPKIVEPCFAWQLPYGLQGIGPYRGIHQICRGPIGYLFFPVARFFFTYGTISYSLLAHFSGICCLHSHGWY